MKLIYNFLLLLIFFYLGFGLSEKANGQVDFFKDHPYAVIDLLEQKGIDGNLNSLYERRQYSKLSSQLNKLLDRNSQWEVELNYLLVLSEIEVKNCDRAASALNELMHHSKSKLSGEGTFYFHYLKAMVFICEERIDQSIQELDALNASMNNNDPYHRYHLAIARARFFKKQGLYEKMSEESTKALDHANQTQNLNHRLNALYFLAFVEAELRNYQSAIEYLNRGEVIAREIENPNQLWRFLACAGICHIELNNFEQGVNYLQESEKLGEELDIPLCCGNIAFLAKGLFMLGSKKEALEVASHAWDLLAKSDDTRDRRNVLHALYDIYRESGDYYLAMEVLEKLNQHREALYDRAYDNLVAEMEARYKVREAELKLAERDNLLQIERARSARNRIWVWAGGAISLILLSLLAVIYFHFNARRKLMKELRKKNQELKKLDETKTRFFEDLSHEFRTPLTLIAGHLRELKDLLSKPQFQKPVNIALRNCNRLADLIDQILDLSKMESGKLSLVVNEIEAHTWFAHKFESFSSMLRSKGVEFKTNIELDKRVLLQVDEDKVEKMINNLMHNACKYVPCGGKVECAVRFKDPPDKLKELGNAEVEIEIADNGPGIPPQFENAIFKRKFRGELPSTGIPGYGIGLALTKELALAQKGSIKLLSQNTTGCRFLIALPVKYTSITPLVENFSRSIDPFKAKKVAALKTSDNSTSTSSILIVEDNVESCDYLNKILSKLYYIHTAKNGLEAFEILKKRKIDLVISDVQMPQCNGIELVQKIRNTPTVFKNTPIILLSGAASDRDTLKGLEAGADDYLVKPIRRENLLARVKNLLLQCKERTKLQLLDQINNGDKEDLIKLRKAEQIVIKNLHQQNFKVINLAKQMSVSPRTLERLFKKYHNLTPVAYIKSQRLKAAYHLLSEGRCTNVSEVRERVGFSSASYFTRSFSQRYDVNPSVMLNREMA